MDLPVFIKGDDIAFNRNLIKPTMIQHKVAVSELYTPSGFVIPIGYDSMNTVDFMENGYDDFYLGQDRSCMAIVINHLGLIHEVTAHVKNGELKIIRRRVLVGDDDFFIRGEFVDTEYMALMAAKLGKNIQDTVSMYCKAFPRVKPVYEFMKITDIMLNLNIRHYTEPFPKPPMSNTFKVKA